jgi:hypothetical protein
MFYYYDDDFDRDDYREDDPKDEVIFQCQEYVKNIANHLYSNDTLDIEDLSYSLEELCHLLSVQVPKPSLNVSRQRKSVSEKFFAALDTLSLYSNNKTKTLTQ